MTTWGSLKATPNCRCPAAEEEEDHKAVGVLAQYVVLVSRAGARTGWSLPVFGARVLRRRLSPARGSLTTEPDMWMPEPPVTKRIAQVPKSSRVISSWRPSGRADLVVPA